jgi:hypothetical protein
MVGTVTFLLFIMIPDITGIIVTQTMLFSRRGYHL